ncbi:hypothetical protein A4A49_55212 [Nicotiana attenuata]|uniref:Uncharacterized protein n=1 Tax=Nicotiana attenuata TaxID=49451 RepID=A0A314L4D2_NICAT|nr:hypothetical protein A4A49_55212 [Nicotiana attenuata]
MGNFKNLLITLLLSFFLLSSSYSSNELHPRNLGSPSENNKAPSPYDHTDHIKNSEPFNFLKKQAGEGEGLHLSTKDKRKKKKKARLNLKRKKGNKKSEYYSSRSFSAMLPKGFVPPSGNSPCHNTYPNSVTFFCDLSTPKLP